MVVVKSNGCPWATEGQYQDVLIQWSKGRAFPELNSGHECLGGQRIWENLPGQVVQVQAVSCSTASGLELILIDQVRRTGLTTAPSLRFCIARRPLCRLEEFK